MAWLVSRLSVLARWVLVACPLFLLQFVPQQSYADDEDIVTGLEGTDAPDILVVSSPLSPTANTIISVGGKAESKATGVNTKDGDDDVTGNATIEPFATADAFLIQAPKKTEVKAQSIGICTGDGDDTVTMNYTLDAYAGTFGGYAAGIFVTDDDTNNTPSNNVKIDASVSGDSSASGVTGDGGGDTLIIKESVSTTSESVIGGAAVPLSAQITKSLKIKTTSKAESSTHGVEGGDGDDEVTVSASLTSTSNAISGALSVGVVAGNANKKTQIVIEANAESTAKAKGIETETAGTETENDFTTPLEGDGLRLAIERTTSTSESADTVNNSDVIIADADAVAGAASAGVSVEVDGSVKSEGNAKAEAESVAISTGGADDEVTNTGALTATADAVADTLSFSLEVGGKTTDDKKKIDKKNKSKSETNATATASAIGIDTEGKGPSSWSLGGELLNGNLLIDFQKTELAAIGNDTLINKGRIDAHATAGTSTKSGGIVVSSGGSTDVEAKSTATAKSTGAYTGAGDDILTNRGIIFSIADADASATALSLGIGQGTEKPDADPKPSLTDDKLTSKSDNSSTASATARGLDADGGRHNKLREFLLSIGKDGLSTRLSRSESSEGGSDTITNTGAITTDATATADNKSASINIEAVGTIKTAANSKATADSTAIAAGAGADFIDNDADLTVNSTAEAESLALGLAVQKPAEAEDKDNPPTKKSTGEASVEVEAKAEVEARAVGIDADGRDHAQEDAVGLTIDGDGLEFAFKYERSSEGGDDTVETDGAIVVNSDATSEASSVAININAAGTTKSETNSNAKAYSAGVLSGAGDDAVTAVGSIVADADSTATALSVTFAQGGGKEAKADAKAVSEAKARGIQTDSANSTTEASGSVTIGKDGLAVALDYTAVSDAGVDTVTSAADIDAIAQANSGAGGATISIDGSSSSDISSEAKADAGGIGAGGGADIVTSTGTVDAIAKANAGALAIGFGQKEGDKTKSKVEVKASATADATATGITTDGTTTTVLDADLVINAKGLVSNAIFTIESLAGDDELVSSGAVNADADALTGAGGATIAIDSQAPLFGLLSGASVKVTAKSIATATGLDTGSGSDMISTTDTVTASANTVSGALSVGYGQKTKEDKAKTKVTAEASSQAQSTATGIRADGGKNTSLEVSLNINKDGLSQNLALAEDAASGDDVVVVGDDVTANALSVAGAVGGTVAIDGAAEAKINATAVSTSIAIVTGGGDDSVTVGCAAPAGCADGVAPDGDIKADANAWSVAVAGGVGVKKQEKAKSSTKIEANTVATATANGIVTDGGDNSRTTDIGLLISDEGIIAGFEQVTTASSGDDRVENYYDVSSDAAANTGAVSVAVTIKGSANASADTTATATSAALDTGGGADTIANYGDMSSTSEANAAAANVSVSTTGTALSNVGFTGAGTEATSKAIGISSAGSDSDKSLLVDTAIDFDSIALTVNVDIMSDSMSADGADDILNKGAITTSSTARAPQVAVGITKKGVAASIGSVESTSSAGAIESGNGDDRIENTGKLMATSDAEAYMANVAFAAKGLAIATNSALDFGTKAESTATGIDADTGSANTKTVDVEVRTNRAQIIYEDTSSWASGDDEIINSGDIDTTALSGVLSGNVAATGKGVSAAVSTAKSTANSTSIRGGDGDDTITNSGALTSDALSGAVAANVAVTNKGVAAAADAVWDGGTTSEATAIGIAGDGGDRKKTTRLAVGTDETGYESTNEIASGVDTIHNTGSITTNADSGAASASVAVAVKGVGIATSTATSNATSKAIDAGAGDEVDDVYNAGELHSTAIALAAGASVSVTNSGAALSAGSVWDGGTKATAESRGIDLGSGGETIINDGKVTSIADAGVAEAAFAVTMKGVAGATATATGKADAVAIDASAGDDRDRVTNTGDLKADAKAGAAAASVSVANKGLALASGAVWDGGTGAEAVASGIDVGDGADVIDNSGDVTVNTLSGAAEAAVAVAVQGVAGAVATSTSESTAVAIKAGDDEDNAVDIVTNSGDLTVTADAGGVSAAVSFSNQGVAIAGGAVWDGGTKAISDAKGMELGAGADAVDNSGDITINSVSLVAELATSVSLTGVAGAVATSTGESSATAIHMGSGNAVDTVTNSGDLSVISGAGAVTAAVSVTNAGLAVAGGSVWDGGTKGISEARGIYMGAGKKATGDSVDNSGDITATSIGTAAEVAAAVSVSGVAGATATSTGSSLAVAIDASEGQDADTIINSGDLKADSTATAATSTVTFTNAGLAVAAGAVWDGGTTANSEGLGIAVGAGKDTVDNSGNITANSRAAAAELGVSVAVTGVAGAVATSTGNSSATAIDTGEEEKDRDTVINSGDLTVNSDALAATATVSVTTAGLAVAGGAAWEGGTKANSQARGIEVGEGADSVDNSGDIDVRSNSIAAEAAVAVAVAGVAGGIATATSDSDASGIDTGDGDYVDKVSNRGNVEATSHSLAATTSVSVTTAGVAVAAGDVWDGGTTAISSARGIEVGEGADDITNEGNVTSQSFAESASANVSVAVAGVAGAVATSTVDSEATALDAGTGEFDDTINNSGDVSALSSAITASAAVSFTAAGVAVAGDAVWEGGTSSAARSQGMELGAGNDAVVSDGTVKAETISSATGSSVAIAVLGVAGAIASADATADSVGINAGAGDDSVDSRDKITASSVSNGNTIMNADSKFGVSAAGNSAWDGGAKSAATSSGVAGGTGIDEITSSGDMDVDAVAVSTSTAVTFTVGGVSGSISTSTANADALGIDGGEDDDFIDNTGNMAVDSDANAISANIALAGIGVAIASDAVWDGGTTSNSSAFGLSGGAGNDFIRSGVASSSFAGAVNTIDVKAKSLVSTNSISVTGAGLSVSTTTGTANADSRAIAAGDGDDTVINASNVTSTADANANSVSIALTGVGVAIASDAFWDGGTKANADSAGIDGGSGADQVINLNGVTANADADTVSASIAYSGILSGAVAASTSTAEADGIRGGAGDDDLLSAGTINATADAQAVGVSVAISGGVAIAGSFLDKTTVADATAKGMAGGVGNDMLSSEETGAIILKADATAVEASIAASVLMAAASANAGANATTVGFDGGNDDDLMVNAGSLTQNSKADSISGSVAFAPGGLGVVADAKSSTEAFSQGFAGGDGNDEVRNSGNIVLTSTADTVGLALSATAAGLAISNASADARADAVGFGGDAGDDRIGNSGDLKIVTDSDAKAAALGVSPVGFSVAAADATAATDVTGLSGGDGEDVLSNSGVIDIDAATSADAAAISASLAGVSISSATTTADIDVTGFSGGNDNDILVNEESGSIDVLAQADLDSIGVSVTLGGFAEADAATLVLANTTGMAGDAGDDMIANAGSVDVRSQSVSNATGASVALFGVAKAKAGGEAQTVATGLSGDDGADTIINASTGSIRVGPAGDSGGDPDANWMSILRGGAVAAGLAGLASAEASAVASTTSTGIAGGMDDDTISNQGDIAVIANSLNETGSAAITIYGSSEAAGESGATTLATGLNGGLGNDYIETLGALDVEAESKLVHSSTSFTYGGSADADSSLEARTEAVGISGGDGEDEILTAGGITVNAHSMMDSRSGAAAVFGSSNAGGKSGATTNATGIDGGAADDIIDSAANIVLTAISELMLDGSSFTLGGSSSSSGRLAAITEADALVGGAGNDVISNRGKISIEASSNMTSKAGSSTGFGSASASNVSGGVTRAAGMLGDDGNDVLLNLLGAELRVNAKTSVNTNAVSYTFAGGADAGTSLTGTSSADGMRGGAGNDILVNHGDVVVTADAALVSTGGASSTFKFTGTNTSTGVSVAAASANGMIGGDGNDTLESTGTIDVTALADAQAINTAKTSVSLVNSKEAGAVTSADATATGLDGGAGDNDVTLAGDVTVLAKSIGYALAVSSGADFTFGELGVAKVNSTANSAATGVVSSGTTGNTVVNNGKLEVTADATTARELIHTITVYRDVRSEDVNEDPDNLPIPENFEGGDRPSFYDDDGNPDEGNRTKYPDKTVIFHTKSEVQDPNVGTDGAYYQVIVTQVDTDGDGVADDEDWKWQQTGLLVKDTKEIVVAEFPSYAAANGNGLDGNGTARATGNATAAALGISLLGEAGHTIENAGQLIVTAIAEGVVNTSADGDAFGDAIASSRSTANAQAIGIELGSGADHVVNTGTISVRAITQAKAQATATGGDICIWFFGWWCGGGGDGYGKAFVDFDVTATGIDAGTGDNTIINAAGAEILVTNRNDDHDSDYSAEVISANKGPAAPDKAPAEETHIDISTKAIVTGDGNDTVTNNGTIRVEAWQIKDTDSITMVGIESGAGNDVVANNGILSVLRKGGSSDVAGVAIKTGEGTDEVRLGDGSVTTGVVNLGAGDDTLVLAGTPVLEDAAGAKLTPLMGTGAAHLVLEGTGQFDNTLPDFNTATKRAAGAYTLPTLNTLEILTIDEGTLELETDYTFHPGGQYATYVHSEGDHGKLLIGGSAMLDGAISVEKRGGTYISNGTRYSLLETIGSLSNTFADVTLPAPRPLLRFGLEQTVNSVDTVATAESFALVANNPLYRQIARNLDSIADDASGDLADVLGTLQSLESGFDEAFASASPDSHQATTQSTVDTGQQMTHLLQNHLGSSRATYRQSLQGQARSFGNVSFAYNNGFGAIDISSEPQFAGYQDSRFMHAAYDNYYSDAGVNQAFRVQEAAKGQAWVLGARAEGNYDEVDGYTDFDSDSYIAALGYDFRLSKQVIVGVTLGYAKTDLDMDQAGGEADIQAWSGGAYASWFNNKAYLEGSVSYARQSFDNRRDVVIGATKRTARSDHDGNAWIGYLGSGYQFSFNDWSLEPYGSLYYFYAQEDGFEETGAGSLNQIIDDRDTEALLGELGAKVVRLQQLRNGTLDWHASVALNHDFDIDDARIGYSYAGAPGTTFGINDRDRENNSTVFGAGLSYTTGNSTISLDYRRQNNDDYDNDAISAVIVVRF